MDDISQRERIVVTDANVLINLIQVDRLDLLGALPGLGFIVPYEVESEIVVPAQSQALAGAVGAGHLRQYTFTTTKELQLYAEYVQVLGTGEAACMAMAEAHGWSIASDERGKFLKLVRLRLGAQRILNTPGVFILAIRANLLSVEEADNHKHTLEMYRFKMPFRSFSEYEHGVTDSRSTEE